MRIHRHRLHRLPLFGVVNCFQFLNFNEDSQALAAVKDANGVVNCFQFLNFNEDSQVQRP